MLERADRRATIIEAMASSGFRALVCSSSTEVLLLTGFWPVMASSVVVHTLKGELRLIVPEDEVELARKTTIAPLIPYQPAGLDFLDPPLDLLRPPLKQALGELGGEKGTIGLQMEEGMQPSSYAVSYQFRSSLQTLLGDLLPRASFRACDPLLEALKAVKTAAELDLIKQACAIAASAFIRAEAVLAPGLRETHIAAAAQSAFETNPAAQQFERSYGYLYCMSGPNSARAAAAFARTRNRRLEEGYLVMMHANTCADGYWTDLTRTFTVGQPSARQQDLRIAIMQARQAGLDAIRPGVQGRDVDHAVRTVMKQHGLAEAFRYATGHGVGFAAANTNGMPRIHPLSGDLLRTGMTFNLEPAAYFDGDGGMRHCDVVAVTEDGAEVLSGFCRSGTGNHAAAGQNNGFHGQGVHGSDRRSQSGRDLLLEQHHHGARNGREWASDCAKTTLPRT